MTADLREMTALDYLRWSSHQRGLRVEPNSTRGTTDLGAHALLCYTLAGIYDLDEIYAEREHNSLQGVYLLTDSGKHTVDPPLTPADLDLLPLVGAAIYQDDRDNVADWADVARRFDTNRDVFEHYTSHQPARKIVTAFLRAGRGPTYARAVMDRAVEHHISPLAYGMELTVGEWSALAEAGVPDLAAIEGYRAAGCSILDAVALAADKVPPGAAVVAARQGIPREEWVDRLAGIRPDWVPYGIEARSLDDDRRNDPEQNGPLAAGHTLDDLKAYADAGWSLSRYNFTGLYYGQGRSGGRIALTPELCRALLAGGLTPADMTRWAAAITTASSGSRRDADYVSSLSGNHYWSDDLLPDVIRLHAAGVRPSHVNDYRYAGCRSIEQVLDAVALGITPKRVVYLRKTYAVVRNSWDKPRLTYQALLRHHEEDTNAAAK